MSGRRLLVHAGMRAIRAYEMDLFGRLLDGLVRIDGIRIWGIADRARFERADADRGAHVRGRDAPRRGRGARPPGITAWDGDFYATGLIERFGLAETGGVLRIGLTHYNTADEIDRLLAALATIAEIGAGGCPELASGQRPLGARS